MLRRRPLGESDQVLALLSAWPGRFDCVAKGARKPTSRWVALAEPFTVLSGQFARGRSLAYLTEARPLRTFAGLRDDYDRLTWGSYLLELFLHGVAPEQPQAAPFRLLVGCLAVLEEGGDPFWVTRWAELRLLRLLGYAPELTHCCGCGDEDVVAFSPEAGGVLCRQCGGGALALAPPVRSVLRFLDSCRLKAALGMDLEPYARRQLERVVQAQWSAHCPQPMRSAGLLNSPVSRLPSPVRGPRRGPP